MKKAFRVRADQIQPLACGYGACIATDMITVEGRRVGFMYRESPDSAADSGWRFLSGHESQEYMDDAENHALYDINTIANYFQRSSPSWNQPSARLSSAIQRPASFGQWSSRQMTRSRSLPNNTLVATRKGEAPLLAAQRGR